MAPAPSAAGSPSGRPCNVASARFTLLIATLAVLVTSLGAYQATRASVLGTVDASLASVSGAGLTTLGPAPDPAAVQRLLTGGDLEDGMVTAVVRRRSGPQRPRSRHRRGGRS